MHVLSKLWSLAFYTNIFCFLIFFKKHFLQPRFIVSVLVQEETFFKSEFYQNVEINMLCSAVFNSLIILKTLGYYHPS